MAINTRPADTLALVTIALGLLATRVSAQGFNYDSVGLDWPGLCVDGARQSPINIVRDRAVAIATPSISLSFEISPSYELRNLENSVNMVPKAGTRQQLIYQGHTFNLLQIHAHAVSEHTFDGFFGGMEFHYVHANASNTTVDANGVPVSLLVVGVTLPLSRNNTNNTFVSRYLQAPTVPGSSKTINRAINMYSLFASSLIVDGQRKLNTFRFYTYPGSLTVPGCLQYVTWLVIDPRSGSRMSVEQLEDFWLLTSKSTGGNPINNRPPQPLKGRTVSTFFAQV